MLIELIYLIIKINNGSLHGFEWSMLEIFEFKATAGETHFEANSLRIQDKAISWNFQFIKKICIYYVKILIKISI